MLKFHLDENVHHAIARALSARGIDVTTTTEAGLLSKDDPTQLAFANSAKRVLVTHDGPLLALAEITAGHAGIAFSQKDTLSIGQLTRALIRLHDQFSSSDIAGRIEFLR